MKTEQVFFKRKDIIAVIIILAVAAVLLIFQSFKPQAQSASIYIESEKICTVSLSADKIFEADGVKGFVFEIKSGKIRIKEAPCENKLCVNTGFLSKSGQTAICLPYKLVLRTDGKSDVDVTVG